MPPFALPAALELDDRDILSIHKGRVFDAGMFRDPGDYLILTESYQIVYWLAKNLQTKTNI